MYGNQSKGLSKSFRQGRDRAISGFAGLASSAIAEPIAGLNALIQRDPSVVESTRNALTIGNPADLVASNYQLPEAVTTGIDYFNQSADALGEKSPFLGAALKTAPAFVGSFAAPQARSAFSHVADDIGEAATGAMNPQRLAQAKAANKIAGTQTGNNINGGELDRYIMGGGTDFTIISRMLKRALKGKQ